MNSRLLIIILILVTGIVFLGFNFGNTTDISLVVTSLNDVPTGMALLIAVCSGIVLGFIGGSLGRFLKKSKKVKKDSLGHQKKGDKASRKKNAGDPAAATANRGSDQPLEDPSPEQAIHEPDLLPKKKGSFWKKSKVKK